MRTIPLLVISIVLCVQLQGQDIHFSQTTMTPLFLNPAQAGAESPIRGSVHYRNQWSSVTSPFVTMAASFDMEIPRSEKPVHGFSAAGISFFHDKAGDAVATNWQVALYYAYHVLLSENSTLGAGFSGGYAGQNLRYEDLQWGNQYNGTHFDPNLSSREPVASFSAVNGFDLGAGLHYQYGKRERYMTANDKVRVQAGISAAHLTQPSVSYYGIDEELAIRFTGYANALFGLGNSNLSLAPSLVYSKQSSQSEMLAGAMVRYGFKEDSRHTGFEHSSALWLGLHFRTKDAVVPSLLFEKGNLAAAISYDINISGLDVASSSQGGFEISLRFISFTDPTKRFKRNVRTM